MHNIRFPGESAEYRTARFELLQAEIDLRKRTEEVAALRRRLPLGGEVPQDYAFTELGPAGSRAVRLSDLFPEGRDTLVLYGFMYGPNMERPCPMCTSMLDALDGNAQTSSGGSGISSTRHRKGAVPIGTLDSSIEAMSGAIDQTGGDWPPSNRVSGLVRAFRQLEFMD